MKVEDLTAGLRVKVYHARVTDGVVRSFIGIVKDWNSSGAVRLEDRDAWVHCSQLRKLKLKKKQPRAIDDRRWFANEYTNRIGTAHETKEAAEKLHNKRVKAILELAVVARYPKY